MFTLLYLRSPQCHKIEQIKLEIIYTKPIVLNKNVFKSQFLSNLKEKYSQSSFSPHLILLNTPSLLRSAYQKEPTFNASRSQTKIHVAIGLVVILCNRLHLSRMLTSLSYCSFVYYFTFPHETLNSRPFGLSLRPW